MHATTIKFRCQLGPNFFDEKGIRVALINLNNKTQKICTRGKLMHLKHFAKSILLIISMSSLASADMTEGLRPPGVGPAPYPGGPGPRPPGPPPGYRPPPPIHRPPPPIHRPPPPIHRPPPPHYPPPHNPPYYPPPHNPPYYPPQPPPHYPPNPGYGVEVKRIYIGRDMYNENIDLRLHANLNYGYRGAQILSVRAITRPNHSGYQDLAQLVVDGYVVATQYDPSYSITLFPQRNVVLDQNARDVRLVLSGSIFVDSIDVEVRRY